MENALTKSETKRLAAFETMIERGFKSFVESGKALAVVRDDRLYRESYKTFDDYCKDRWGLERTHAHRLIESAEVVNRIVDNLLSIDNKFESTAPVQVPANVGQTRELAKAPVEEQAEVWEEVVETTAVPTAKAIKAVVEKRKKSKAKSDTVSGKKPAKEKVFKADASMPEWYMDDNSVAIPEELYPVWRAKQRFFELANGPVSQETCDQLAALGQQLNHPATVELGHELWAKLSKFQIEFSRAIASGEPHVLSADKTTWMSKREVASA